MGYYKDTGSLRSMASAEAILKKRMPKFDGVWNGAVQDGRREKGKKRMGAFPGASRPVPRLQGTTQWRPPSQYLRFSLTGS